jgi:hypothetical protein
VMHYKIVENVEKCQIDALRLCSIRFEPKIFSVKNETICLFYRFEVMFAIEILRCKFFFKVLN